MFRTVVEVDTKKGSCIDITDTVNNAIKDCIVKEGICHVYMTATTAALTINENDTLFARDFMKLAKSLANEDAMYAHPGNAHSHLRSSIFGVEKSMPVSKGSLVLGKWQRLLLWEFDTTNRKRQLIVSVGGD